MKPKPGGIVVARPRRGGPPCVECGKATDAPKRVPKDADVVCTGCYRIALPPGKSK